MKSLVSAFTLIIILSSLGLSQTKRKPAPKPKSSAASFSNESFDFSKDPLPPRFIGNDPLSVTVGALRLWKAVQKDEFETEATVLRRFEEELKKPLFGNVHVEDPVSLMVSLQNADVEYDADQEEMFIKFNEELFYIRDNEFQFIQSSDGSHLMKGFVGTVIREKLGYSVGQTSFGVRKKFLSVKESSWNVIPLKGLNLLTENIHFSVKLSEAKKTKANLRAIVVGHLKPPFLSIDESEESATIDYPEKTIFKKFCIFMDVADVWIYEVDTGQVRYCTKCVAS
jgi:hypothetical protein